MAAYAYDKCDYIEYQIGVVGQQVVAAQAALNGGELNPQQRAAGEKALMGVRTQLANLEKSLQFCRG